MKLLQRLKNLFLPEGKISDGFHSFDELYHYRMLYNAAFFNSLEGKYEVHKSYRHSDGELCFGGGWFIVMAYLPTGQVSNHYRIEDWNLFDIPERWKQMNGMAILQLKQLIDYIGFVYTIMNIILYGNVSRTIN